MRCFLLFGCIAALAAVPALAADDIRLTLQDTFSADPIGETALSPDGKAIAIIRSGQIALMPSEGGWPVTLTSTAGGKSGLSWSPDGKQIAYSSQNSIWVVSAAGGAPRKLTIPQQAVSGDPRSAGDHTPHWSLDGRWILFLSGRGGAVCLAVVSSDGKVTSLLTDPQMDANHGVWSPKGDRIVYISREKGYESGRLYLLNFNADSGRIVGSPTVLYTAPADPGGGWSIGAGDSPVWSPDGKSIATILQNTGWNHVYLVPVEGGTPKQITDGAFEASSPRFSPDGKSLVFLSNRGLPEADNLWLVSAQGGEAHQITKFDIPGVSSQPEWAPDGQSVYYVHQSSIEAPDLVVQGVAPSSAPKYLTHTTPANIAASAQVPERVTWKSKDGKEIAGLLYVPRNAKPGTKFPAILWIHGGPEGLDRFTFDRDAGSPQFQYLVQAGYVVLRPNYRGGAGYGEAFRNLNIRDSGGGEMDDVASGAQYLISRGLVDPARIAIGGISHGGTMVGYAVTRYPNLFAAAISIAGVVDREMFIYRSNHPSAIRWMMKMGGSPSESPDTYRRANVLLSIDKVKTPILIIHGENDPQVPPAESAAFAAALREHHKTVFYFTYPDELHGLAQPAHRLDAIQKEMAFLEHYINPRLGTVATATETVVFPGTLGHRVSE